MREWKGYRLDGFSPASSVAAMKESRRVNSPFANQPSIASDALGDSFEVKHAAKEGLIYLRPAERDEVLHALREAGPHVRAQRRLKIPAEERTQRRVLERQFPQSSGDGVDPQNALDIDDCAVGLRFERQPDP